MLGRLRERLSRDDFKKLGLLLAAPAIAVPVAALYGVLHNQISFTVGPEYFTLFKFRQFGLEQLNLPDRLRASLVGLMASWWMGVPVGFLAGASGLVHDEPRRMARAVVESTLIIVGVTMIFGLLGLTFGLMRTIHIRAENYGDWFIPNHVKHLRRFLCAGYMHNASYLGAVIAVAVAWAFQLKSRLSERRSPHEACQRGLTR